jgi:hypothetical protein
MNQAVGSMDSASASAAVVVGLAVSAAVIGSASAVAVIGSASAVGAEVASAVGAEAAAASSREVRTAMAAQNQTLSVSDLHGSHGGDEPLHGREKGGPVDTA